MKPIGLFYGTSTNKTAKITEAIKSAFDNDVQIDIINVETAKGTDFTKYENLILGAATWFDGELPTYWDELVPDLEGLKLKKQKVAIFGLGDQVNYPENFVDGIGLLAELFEVCGAKLVGLTSPKGYEFEHSKALKDGMFLGLAIDVENQSDKTDKRIKDWVKQLATEFS